MSKLIPVKYVWMAIVMMTLCNRSHAGGLDPQQESELASLYAKILTREGDQVRKQASEDFKTALKALLYKEGAMSYPFDSLRMCKLASPDGRFRIFNWNVPLEGGAQLYEAIVMIPDEKTSMVKLVELNDDSADLDKVETRTTKPDHWFGALYFDIIPFKKGGGDHYVLLGWDGDTRITNKKVIEVLSFNGNNIRFGAPVFKTDKGMMRRLVYTYGEELTMSVVYQPKNKRIVLDHLAPRNQSLEGQYQFYGPDMSFDALEYKKGKWYMRSNVDYTRKRVGKDRDFNDPRMK